MEGFAQNILINPPLPLYEEEIGGSLTCINGRSTQKLKIVITLSTMENLSILSTLLVINKKVVYIITCPCDKLYIGSHWAQQCQQKKWHHQPFYKTSFFSKSLSNPVENGWNVNFIRKRGEAFYFFFNLFENDISWWNDWGFFDQLFFIVRVKCGFIFTLQFHIHCIYM